LILLKITISVNQVSLAEKLEVLGADIIQTEGGTSASPVSPGIQGLIEKVCSACELLLPGS
jgi:hypothetical protein